MGQGVIPDDWTDEYCRYAVCWPNSPQWLAVLRGVLVLPATGRFWDENTGIITDAQSVIKETFDHNLHLEEVIVSCNDEGLTQIAASIGTLATAFMRIAANSNQCCCTGEPGGSAGYAGTTTQPVGGGTVPIYGNSPPATLPPGEEFPEGFESVEQWNAHKCSIANLIVDGVLYTLNFLGSLTITNVTALAGLIGAGIAGILVFPPVGIAIMVGAVLALIGFLAMFLQIRLEIIDRREEFVCAMYESDSVEAAIGVLADLMDLVIALVTTSGVLGAALKTVLLLLFNGDALNQLFDSTADYSYPDADCEGCLPCEEFYYEFEAGLDGFDDVAALPACFGLGLNGACALSAAGGILSANITGGSPTINGAFGKTGIDYLITDETNIEVTLRTSGTGSLYIDFIIVYDDASCRWETLSNNDGASGIFHGISRSLATDTGKRVNELYLYLATANDEGDGEFLTEFEKIGFFCE